MVKRILVRFPDVPVVKLDITKPYEGLVSGPNPDGDILAVMFQLWCTQGIFWTTAWKTAYRQIITACPCRLMDWQRSSKASFYAGSNPARGIRGIKEISMRVRELIEKLEKLDQNAEVQVEYHGGGGCDTCGFGGDEQVALEKVIDLETVVVLSVFS